MMACNPSVYVLFAEPEPELVDVELLSGEGVVASGCCGDRSSPIKSADSAD